jgi:hypothetical protein
MASRERVLLLVAGDATRVVIGPRREPQDWLFAAIVIVALCLGPTALLREVVRHPPPVGPLFFMLFCLAGFISLGGLMAFALLWRVFGTEELVSGGGTLTIVQRLLLIRRTRTFRLSEVGRFWIESRYYAARGRSFVRRGLAFEWQGKTVTTRSQLSAEEGEALMNGPLRRLAGSGGQEVGPPPRLRQSDDDRRR